VELTITGSSGGWAWAVGFYPVVSNPDAEDDSLEMVGGYAAVKGLVLNPEYQINEPLDTR
jgi:hypothetical protein